MPSTTCKPLMHVRERGTRGRALRTGTSYPRNQSFNLEVSGHGGFLHSSPTLSVARESIAVTSRSDSGISTAGAATQLNLPLQKLRLTLRCSDRHLVVGRIAKDTAGTLLLEGPARSIGSSTGCGAQEERWSPEGLPPL